MQVQLTQFDKDQLARFNSLVERRRKTYGHTMLKIVLVRQPNQTGWKDSLTLVHFNHKDHPPEKEETFRYTPPMTVPRNVTPCKCGSSR